MKKLIIIFVIGIIFLSIGAIFFYPAKQQTQPQQDRHTPSVTQQAIQKSYSAQAVVTDLFVPWSIVFTENNRMLVSERKGIIREINNLKLTDTPLISFAEVLSKEEEGLMGLAVDPTYETNNYIYACLASNSNGKNIIKVHRLIDKQNILERDRVIIDDIPGAPNHAGCRLRFGPDSKLYVSTGDATVKTLAQNENSPAGKMLRLNADGTIPSDNPIPNSPIFASGLRNTQGFDWYPGTEILYAVDHGPSTFDGPAGGDEVNVIKKGANYGWPIVSHEKTDPRFASPKLVFTPAVAPASGMFYSGSLFDELNGTFLVGLLRGEGILQIVVDKKQPETILSHRQLPGIKVGRVRDIVQSPSGDVYFTTSNRDGRGNANVGDDKIYKLTVQN